jgi:hypothetical protein
MFDERLSNFTIFNINSDTISFRVSVNFDTPDSANSAYVNTFTMALVGCEQQETSSESLIHRDQVLRCDLETTDWFTGDPESVSSTKVFNQLLYNFIPRENKIISGGAFNIIHTGFTALKITGAPTRRDAIFTISGLSAGQVNIGYFFLGQDLPLQLDPTTFSWRARIINDRFTSRSLSSVSSDGSIQRSAGLDIINIPLERMHGQTVGLNPNPVADVSNFMRVIMANTGQPLLLNPYPYAALGLGSSVVDDDMLFLIRQNFFSIYGFANQDMNFFPSREGGGLQSKYNSRIEFNETR